MRSALSDCRSRGGVLDPLLAPPALLARPVPFGAPPVKLLVVAPLAGPLMIAAGAWRGDWWLTVAGGLATALVIATAKYLAGAVARSNAAELHQAVADAVAPLAHKLDQLELTVTDRLARLEAFHDHNERPRP